MAQKTKRYKLDIGLAQTVEEQVTGKYIFITASSEPLKVQAWDNQKRLVIDGEGLEGGFSDGPFDASIARIQVSTETGNAGSAAILLSDRPIKFTALTGTVNIIDETAPKYAAQRGQGYVAGFFQAGVASEYVAHKLRNPANSGVDLIVTGLQAEGGGSAVTADWWLAASAGTDLANVRATMPRRGGSAASKAVFSWQQTVNTGTPTEPADSAVLPLQATMTEPMQSQYPLSVPPGYEVVVLNKQSAAAQGVTFAWEEWAVGSL